MKPVPFVNISSYLPLMANSQPDTPAIICPDEQSKNSYKQLTFKQLNEESNLFAAGLNQINITRGTRTVLMVKPGFNFFALTFALFKIGAIPILVDPGMGVKNLGKCLLEAEPQAFIGIPKAHFGRTLGGWGKKTIKTKVIVGAGFFPGCITLDNIRKKGKAETPFLMPETNPEETAAILFTSGSTGVPKGVVYTHSIFISQVEQLRKTYNIKPGEINLPTFPLFALFDPALGMTTVIPLMDFTRPADVNPCNIINPIKQFKITNMFGSPALIDRVGSYGAEHNVKLPSLKRIISAGAPARHDALRNFNSMLAPGVEIFTPYGATESLPVCSVGSNEILNETGAKTAAGTGVCVGKPVDDINLSIIKITDDPIPDWSDDLLLKQGETGEIVVKGDVVTQEYYNRPDLAKLAKIIDNKEVYHRMGDLGYMDKEGRLWFCGRKSHRVQTEKGTLFTIPCEAIFNTNEKVYRTALVGISGSSKNDYKVPVLCVELKKAFKNASKEQISMELFKLGAKHPNTKEIEEILFHKSFPVDIRHNSKIFREKLAIWAAKGKTIK